MESEPFEGNKYAEVARRDGDELTRKALGYLAKQGELGEEYMMESIHQEGSMYFEDFFNCIEEVEHDFELYRKISLESETDE